MASMGSAFAAPLTNAHVAASTHASPSPTLHHKKCSNGQHYAKVNGKWSCHKK
ncbi:hypothetical protein [Streptomyces mirabilis]|uniref:hypothetical protein n=1 Tax=Streptomyces mirabilis TaxID=68239 RepID=UPI0035D93CCC